MRVGQETKYLMHLDDTIIMSSSNLPTILSYAGSLQRMEHFFKIIQFKNQKSSKEFKKFQKIQKNSKKFKKIQH